MTQPFSNARPEAPKGHYPERKVMRLSAQGRVDASSTRLPPIMLTAILTVLDMIPIAPTVFWGAIAFAIMGCLLVGAILHAGLLANTACGLVPQQRRSSRDEGRNGELVLHRRYYIECEVPWQSNRGPTENHCL